MAGIFIVFALLSSFVFPKRNPDFPGKKWRWGYVLLSVVLFALMMSTVVVFGKEEEEKHAEETAATHPGETSSTETMPGTTTAPTTTEAALPPQYENGDAAAGEDVWDSKGCSACHMMEAAGATGTIGPNLDEKKPSEALIADRVVNGKGQMPPFKSSLTDQQIADLVAYLYQSTHSS
jgi:mono/diheme cytochrome c family protein